MDELVESILDYVRKQIKEEGYAPSVREMFDNNKNDKN